MPTEDDLRIAFRTMERHTPDAVDVLRAVYDHPRRSARSWRLSPRVPRRHVLRAGLALGAAGAVTAVAVTAVAVIAAVAHGPATKATPLAAPALRTRLLAAIDTASVDQGGLQLAGTILAVNHTRHVWGQWHGNFVLGFPLDAAGIRAEIANGQLNVAGSAKLNGQQAVELEITLPPSNEAPPHVTTARLWVDATSYLPMQQFLRLSDGEQNVTDYTFLAPTAENLAKLRPEIPAGYTQAGYPQAGYTQAGYTQVTGPQPKTK